MYIGDGVPYVHSGGYPMYIGWVPYVHRGGGTLCTQDFKKLVFTPYKAQF